MAPLTLSPTLPLNNINCTQSNLLNFGKRGQMVYFMRMYFRIFISFQRFSKQKDGIRFDSKQKLGAGSEVRFDNMDPYNTIFGSGSVYLIDVRHFQSR